MSSCSSSARRTSDCTADGTGKSSSREKQLENTIAQLREGKGRGGGKKDGAGGQGRDAKKGKQGKQGKQGDGNKRTPSCLACRGPHYFSEGRDSLVITCGAFLKLSITKRCADYVEKIAASGGKGCAMCGGPHWMIIRHSPYIILYSI